MIVTVVGNLCGDPELRETSGGVPVAELRIAENRNYQDSHGRWHQSPSFYSVTVWRKVAEHAAASLRRGDRVVAVGRMRQDEWTTDTGQKHRRYVIDADELAASIRFATVAVSKDDDAEPSGGDPG
jgi:single-strand DNA-binding protein